MIFSFSSPAKIGNNSGIVEYWYHGIMERRTKVKNYKLKVIDIFVGNSFIRQI